MQQLFLSMESAFYYLISLSSFDHFLILVLFGICFQLKDWKQFLSLYFALTIGSIAGLLLADFKITYFSASTIKLALSIGFCAVGIHHIISNSMSANAVRYNFFAIIGLILGTSVSLHYIHLYGYSLKFYKLAGYSLGITLSYLVVSFSALLISSLIIALFKTDRRSFNIAVSGIAIGVSLVLIYLRY
jgi:hypothetical protein